VRKFSSFCIYKSLLGTIEYHGNTEVLETVIFMKCRNFAKSHVLPCFSQNAMILHFSQELFSFSNYDVGKIWATKMHS